MQRLAIRHRASFAFAFASVLLVALALHIQHAFAQSIPSGAKYSCDFSGGYCDFIEQSALGDAPPSARRSSIVSTVSRSGGTAVRLHTEPGDANVHGSGTWERNDILKTVDSSYCNEGQEEWWAVSVLFPSDYVFPPGPEAGIIMDFHHNGSGGQANYEVQTIPGIGLRARGYGGSSVNQGQYDALIPDPYGAVNNVTRNVWYDFVFHVRWSSSGNGIMEGWLNGRKFQSHSGATLYSGMQCYLKLANYHAPFGQPSSIIYDRVVRGTSASDVAISALDTVGNTPVTPTTTMYTLSASISGSGSVSSSPSGLNCSSSCSGSFPSGSIVTLTASPSSGSTFAGWSGACSGTGLCSVSLGANQSVSAVFTQSASQPTGTGSQPVSGGIEPAPDYTVTAGQSVTFTAKVSGSAGMPTGTVAFRANGSTMAGCGAVPLSGGVATCTTSSLPVGAHAITGNYSGDSTYGVGVMGPMTETVNAAQTGAPTPTPVSSSGGYNVQGLWWQPRESGWGVNLTEQGDMLFATWFTYDAQGHDQWFVMSKGDRIGDNAYQGTLYRTTGAAFSSFDPSSVQNIEVGSAYFNFDDANNGTFIATVDGQTITKSITRFVYANPMPTCALGADPNSSSNFQDMWWRTGGSESGWGLNVTHQGSILFVTWFTYDADGSAMWLSGSSLAQTGYNTFSGTLERTTGPAFNSSSFDPSRVSRVPVGSMTIAFNDGTTGTMTYTVNGVTQSKPIQRFVYATPATACR